MTAPLDHYIDAMNGHIEEMARASKIPAHYFPHRMTRRQRAVREHLWHNYWQQLNVGRVRYRPKPIPAKPGTALRRAERALIVKARAA